MALRPDRLSFVRTLEQLPTCASPSKNPAFRIDAAITGPSTGVPASAIAIALRKPGFPETAQLRTMANAMNYV